MMLRSLSLALACVALLPAAAHAEEAAGAFWIADETGCLAANPAPQPNERIEWTGACVEGKLSGEGILTWYQNDQVIGRDEGTFSEGALSGQGKITMGEGSTYIGGFPGAGRFTLPTGLSFPAQTVRENSGWRIEQVAETGL